MYYDLLMKVRFKELDFDEVCKGISFGSLEAIMDQKRARKLIPISSFIY